MTAFPTYSTGTVAVANGATAIIGTGTNWTGVNAVPGDDIVVDGHTVVVLDVTDATHLVIDAWPFTSVVAGASYKIIKRSPLRFVGGDTMADVSTLVAALNTDGFYVFVSSTLSVPDPSYGDENQFALQPSTGKLWLKTGGAWVFQGIYKGFNITGAWSGATAYQIGDVVSLSGSSYLALAASTNQTPPNVTYWQVLAAKGDTGATGSTGAAGTNGVGYGGTSTTSLTVGTGSKAFTTQAGLAYQVGSYVRASSVANGANYMEGFVTAYASTTLTVNVTKVGGSGTIASWTFAVAGAPGSGDLLSTNNLSDVANAATSRANLGIMFPPQGRLTLQTAEPVMTVTRSAKTTIYYTPYVGNQIPIYDGSKFIPTVFSEISVLTTNTTKNPAAIGVSKVNDWFVWDDAGTLRLTHGPDWTSDTARSAGTALTMVSGIWLNNASITNGPAASRGTYVGTTRSDPSSQLNWLFGVTDAAAFLGVWNAYNRVDVATVVQVSADSWTYGTAAFRSANNSATMRVSYVDGLAYDAVDVRYSAGASNAGGGNASVGIGVNSTTAFSGETAFTSSTVAFSMSAVYSGTPGIGFNFLQAVEYSQTGTTSTFYGDAGAPAFIQSGFRAKLKM